MNDVTLHCHFPYFFDFPEIFENIWQKKRREIKSKEEIAHFAPR